LQLKLDQLSTSQTTTMRLKFLITKAMDKIAARNAKFEFPITDLPNELVAHIIEFINDISALRNLACSCHRLQHLTEPVLWRKLLVRERQRLRRTLDAYGSRRERAAALQVLNVPCKSESGNDMSGLASVIRKAQNLKELMIESPSCNLADFEADEVWRPMMDQLFLPFQHAIGDGLFIPKPLQKLTRRKSLHYHRGSKLHSTSLSLWFVAQSLTRPTVTLHLNGPKSPYWTPDHRSLPIFLHPTLKYLKLACVNFPDDLFNEVTERATTPLQHLVLEECNITHRGLHGLLALPKALEHLYLGENCHNERQFPNHEVAPSYNHLFRRDAEATVEAIGQQKHSLRSLTYVAASVYSWSTGQLLGGVLQPRRGGIDAAFADFIELESVTAIGSSSGFERAVMSSVPPPKLRYLTYQAENPLTSPQGSSQRHNGDEAEMDRRLVALLPFLRAPSSSVPPGFKSLKIIYQRAHTQFVELTREKQTHVEKTAKALKAVYGADLTVGFKSFRGYYPPFLYGEREPEEQMIFDSEKGGFVRTAQAHHHHHLEDDDTSDDDDSDDTNSDEEWTPQPTVCV